MLLFAKGPQCVLVDEVLGDDDVAAASGQRRECEGTERDISSFAAAVSPPCKCILDMVRALDEDESSLAAHGGALCT